MKAQEVVDWLDTIVGLSGAPRRLRSTIEGGLASHFGLLAIRAAEEAERLEVTITNLINKRQVAAENRGVLSGVILVGAGSDHIAGCCYVNSFDSPTIRSAKKHRLAVEPLLNRIRALTFAEFERFGARILYELGAKRVSVTRQSNDQGIDFYGILSLGQYHSAPGPFFRLAHDIEVRFAGQAKHYPNTSLTTAVIRELVGSVALARYKTYSSEVDPFEDFALKPYSPLVCLVFTTGRLSRGTQSLSDRSGIIARSGEQLAVFLADRGVGMEVTPSGATFKEEIFQDWLVA